MLPDPDPFATIPHFLAEPDTDAEEKDIYTVLRSFTAETLLEAYMDDDQAWDIGPAIALINAMIERRPRNFSREYKAERVIVQREKRNGDGRGLGQVAVRHSNTDRRAGGVLGFDGSFSSLPDWDQEKPGDQGQTHDLHHPLQPSPRLGRATGCGVDLDVPELAPEPARDCGGDELPDARDGPRRDPAA